MKKVISWCKNHKKEITVGAITLLGVTASAILGVSIGKKKGYLRAMSEMPEVVETCGATAFMSLWDALCETVDESGNEDYVRTVENIDGRLVGHRASDKYYSDETIRNLIKREL